MECDLSIVIVSWNCREVLEICLGHLRRSRTELSYEVILVDNASTDGTPEMVERVFPHVQVVRSDSNLGFGRANNLGFRRARGRCVVLLNPDAYLVDDLLLQDLAAWLDRHPAYGAIGCRITYPGGIHQVGDAGWRPTARAMIYSALGLPRLSSYFRGVFAVGRETANRQPVDVDWICGAFMLVRRSVIDQVGGFDESIFMYAEDVEWGCRARDGGIRLGYLPWREVVHVQAGTQYRDGAARISTRWLENLVMVYRRFDRTGTWPLVRAAMICGFWLRAVVYWLAARLIARPALANKSRAMRLFARRTWSMR